MSILYFNGDFVSADNLFLSHQDCGFATGIGVFDSMLAIDGTPQYFGDHLARIEHDCKKVIGIAPLLNPPPLKGGRKERDEISVRWGDDDLCAVIEELIRINNLQHGYTRIRTTVTGGIVDRPLAPAKEPSILIDTAPCQPPPETPIKCAIISDFPRIAGCALENCKRLDYSRSYAARRQAEKQGAEEAILINTNGNIACGATSNIFIEEDGVLFTPPLSEGVLAGVTRKNILKTENAREETISIERLKKADKIYLTNSFMGLRSVTLI